MARESEYYETVRISQPEQGDAHVLTLVSMRFADMRRTLVKPDSRFKIIFELDESAIHTAPA